MVRTHIHFRKNSDNHFGDRADARDVAALLSIVLDRGAGEPLGRQLYRQLREHILSGRLCAGARLPSTRRMAEELEVSRIVPLTAYDHLAVEGYIEPRRGSGQYVRDLGEVGAAPNLAQGPRPTPPDDHLAGRPFDSYSQATDLFPTRQWARLLAKGWRQEGAAAVEPAHAAGLPSLRAAIARHLFAIRGVRCEAEQIIITAGAADALQLIVSALRPGGTDDAIWVEDPGHVGARRTLAREGLRIAPIPVDEDGMDVEEGRRRSPRAAFALVTPSRQFPLGMPLSLPRRIALINWARESGAVVIEDDFDSEVRFSGRPLESLLNLDQEHCVLSIGSFSKLTFPGLRLGYIAGPERLIRRLVAARARQKVLVATTAQPALRQFIEDGGFARHLRTLRRRITQRRLVLAEALRARLADELVILPQEVGMHFTVTLNARRGAGPGDQEIAARAARRGVNLDPLSIHAVEAPARQGFLLGYAGWDEGQIRAGVDALAALLSRRRG